jgi:gliding motility-associated-like protein
VNGENPIFLPIVSLYDFDSYLLTIYDRWGGVVFQSEERTEGWNGEAEMGDLKPQGTYVYHLTFQDRAGKIYNYRGIVTMLIDKE